MIQLQINLLLIFSYTEHTKIKLVLLGLWHVHWRGVWCHQ